MAFFWQSRSGQVAHSGFVRLSDHFLRYFQFLRGFGFSPAARNPLNSPVHDRVLGVSIPFFVR